MPKIALTSSLASDNDILERHPCTSYAPAALTSAESWNPHKDLQIGMTFMCVSRWHMERLWNPALGHVHLTLHSWSSNPSLQTSELGHFTTASCWFTVQERRQPERMQIEKMLSFRHMSTGLQCCGLSRSLKSHQRCPLGSCRRWTGGHLPT